MFEQKKTTLYTYIPCFAKQVSCRIFLSENYTLSQPSHLSSLITLSSVRTANSSWSGCSSRLHREWQKRLPETSMPKKANASGKIILYQSSLIALFNYSGLISNIWLISRGRWKYSQFFSANIHKTSNLIVDGHPSSTGIPPAVNLKLLEDAISRWDIFRDMWECIWDWYIYLFYFEEWIQTPHTSD